MNINKRRAKQSFVQQLRLIFQIEQVRHMQRQVPRDQHGTIYHRKNESTNDLTIYLLHLRLGLALLIIVHIDSCPGQNLAIQILTSKITRKLHSKDAQIEDIEALSFNPLKLLSGM